MQPQQFSLYGAADLGARQTAAQRRQQQEAARSGDGPAPAADGAVFDTGDETFAVNVVERSRSVPVILDLWAEWCGPCKQLSPVLEKLATEAAGQWVLAKVDVDANPQLSAALRVQSIPMVVAVIGGQMVDGFLGALPEAQVREWLGQVLAAAEQLGVTQPARPRLPVVRRRVRPHRVRSPSRARTGPCRGPVRVACPRTPPSRRPSKQWTPVTSKARPPRSRRCWPLLPTTRWPSSGWPRSS